MIKGHNLMDLAFFILKIYMSCTEIHVHITPDRHTQIVCTGQQQPEADARENARGP